MKSEKEIRKLLEMRKKDLDIYYDLTMIRQIDREQACIDDIEWVLEEY